MHIFTPAYRLASALGKLLSAILVPSSPGPSVPLPETGLELVTAGWMWGTGAELRRSGITSPKDFTQSSLHPFLQL